MDVVQVPHTGINQLAFACFPTVCRSESVQLSFFINKQSAIVFHTLRRRRICEFTVCTRRQTSWLPVWDCHPHLRACQFQLAIYPYGFNEVSIPYFLLPSTFSSLHAERWQVYLHTSGIMRQENSSSDNLAHSNRRELRSNSRYLGHAVSPTFCKNEMQWLIESKLPMVFIYELLSSLFIHCTMQAPSRHALLLECLGQCCIHQIMGPWVPIRWNGPESRCIIGSWNQGGSDWNILRLLRFCHGTHTYLSWSCMFRA